MTLQTYLELNIRRLLAANIATARLDVFVLLEDVLGMDRAQLLAYPEREITDEQQLKLATLISRRVRHEPLAYIRGRVEFYGLEFVVSPSVLVPRPESETIIELLGSLVGKSESRKVGNVIVDIGTGSGALAISAELEFPGYTVMGTDIDPACLGVARQNAKRLKAKVTFVAGNLLEPLIKNRSRKLTGETILLCNLPYVPDEYAINEAARHEPKLALFAGPDGLDLYRQLFAQISPLDCRPILITESLPSQHTELAKIAKQFGYMQQVEDDFIQLFNRDN